MRALAQKISKSEFKVLTIHPLAVTFPAETGVMSHQSLSGRGTELKHESPTILVSGSNRPKSDDGSCDNVHVVIVKTSCYC